MELNHISFLNSQTKIVEGSVVVEPDRRLNKAYYTIEIRSDNVKKNQIAGRFLVTLPLYPTYNYGDILRLKCSFEKPKNEQDSVFQYDRYLAEQDIWILCSRPQLVQKIGDGVGVWYTYLLIKLKSSINTHIEQLWPEPVSSFMAGILYGSKRGFSPELMNSFSKTGVTHIIAISGSNISIIGVALMSIISLVGLSKRKAFWILVSLILLFVVFTGLSASAVRAAVMAIVTLYSKKIGRATSVHRILIYTVFVMILFNPYVLVWDVGFQLSFLATLGLLYVSPMLRAFFIRREYNVFIMVFLDNLVTTLSAIIVTLPFILFQFGTLSVVAPFVNCAILWIIPWLMLCGFCSVLVSFFSMGFGKIIAFIGECGGLYVIKIVEWFGSKSWASLSFHIPWWLMIVVYIGMTHVWYRSYIKIKKYV
jgi:competence protein ComEC